jgi:hypothetical protein
MLDRKAIETIIGVSGMVADDVLKVPIPRIDLKVVVEGFEIVPFMGLTSWAAFRKGSQNATVMGDLVVLEDEINPAISAAVESGLYVTALHNHFVREQPSVMFMHIEATADEATLERGVRRSLDAIRAVRQEHPVPGGATEMKSDLDLGHLEEIIAAKGEFKNGVFKAVLGRPNVPVRCTRCGDLEINSAMGYNTWAAFQGTNDRAAICGDFAQLELEVATVIRELRAGGIEVVVIHNHMFFESPRIIFMHFWGVGKVIDLATTFRHALDQTQNEPPVETCCSS